jgi:hypothetical protein
MREQLIDVIINLAGDEYETKYDLIDLAKKSDNQLVEDIIHIAYFYRNQLEDVNT